MNYLHSSGNSIGLYVVANLCLLLRVWLRMYVYPNTRNSCTYVSQSYESIFVGMNNVLLAYFHDFNESRFYFYFDVYFIFIILTVHTNTLF